MCTRSRKSVLDLMMVGCVAIALAFCARGATAQDEKKEDASPPAAADAAPPEAAAPAPIDPKAFPPYFTGTSPEPDKPLWPDPTGANSGYWTTPSPGPVGDGDPKAKTIPELYDR
ncbi:MAG TPA: hypothetical protein VGZ26_04215, partial [Pirellulales bacterium]|nr:hypothetical protein [Pirellulales bacterium]